MDFEVGEKWFISISDFCFRALTALIRKWNGLRSTFWVTRNPIRIYPPVITQVVILNPIRLAPTNSGGDLLPNPSSKQCSLELLRIYESARLETSLGEENDDGARVQMNNSLPALTSDTSPSVVNLFRINKVADRLSWIAQPGNRGEPHEFYNLCLSLSRFVLSN